MSKRAGPNIPTLHKTTHEDGGTDEISVTGLSGLLADDQKPKIETGTSLPTTGNYAGRLFFRTDEAILYRHDGTNWVKISVTDYPDLDDIPLTFEPVNHNLVDTIKHPVSGLTTGHVLQALGPTTYGFSTPPSATPLAHASSHEKGGTDYVDPMRFATLTVSPNTLDMADYATIKEAVDALPSGGYIYLCDGTHNISATINVSTAKNITIIGRGNCTITMTTNGIYAFDFSTVQSPKFHLEGVTFSFGTTSGCSLANFNLHCPRDIRFKDVRFFGGTTSSPIISLITGATGSSNPFSWVIDGCHLSNQSSHSFINTTSSDGGGVVQTLDILNSSIVISQPFLRSTRVWRRVHFINNYIVHVNGPKEFIYSPDGFEYCSFIGNYCLFGGTSAIGSATAIYGGTVLNKLLFEGNNVEIDSNINLTDGNGSENKIYGNNFIDSNYFSSGYGINMQGDRNIISNNTFYGGTTGWVINFGVHSGIIACNTWRIAPTITNSGLTVDNLVV